MKKILIILFTCSLIGCAGHPEIITTPPSNSTEISDLQFKKIDDSFHKYLPIAKQVLKVSGKIALRFAVSPEDMKAKAEMINGSAKVFKALAGGSAIPSQTDIERAFSAYFPTSKTHWAVFSNDAIGLTSTIASMADGYTGLFLEGMQALAEVAEEISQPYL